MSLRVENLNSIVSEDIQTRLAVVKHNDEVYHATCPVYEVNFGNLDLNVFAFAEKTSNAVVWETILKTCNDKTPLALLLAGEQSIWIDIKNKVPYLKIVNLKPVEQPLLRIGFSKRRTAKSATKLSINNIVTTATTVFKKDEHEDLLQSYVQIRNICSKNHTVTFETVDVNRIKKTHYIAEKGDIIFVKQRPKSNKFAYVQQSCIVPMSCLILRAKESYCSELLFSLLILEETQRNIQTMLDEKAVESITNEDILNIELPFEEIPVKWGISAEIIVNEWLKKLNEEVSLNSLCNHYYKMFDSEKSYSSFFNDYDQYIWINSNITKLFQIILLSNNNNEEWRISKIDESKYYLPAIKVDQITSSVKKFEYLDKDDIVLTVGEKGIHSAVVSKKAIAWVPNNNQIILRFKDEQLKEIISNVKGLYSKDLLIFRNFKEVLAKYFVFYFRTKKLQDELKKVRLDCVQKSFEKIEVKIPALFEFLTHTIEKKLEDALNGTEADIIYSKMKQLDKLFLQLDEFLDERFSSNHIQFENVLGLDASLIQEIIAVYLIQADSEIDIHFYNSWFEILKLESKWNKKHIVKGDLYKLPLYDESVEDDAYSVFYDCAFDIDYEPDIIISKRPLDATEIKQGLQYSNIIEIINSEGAGANV